MTRQLAILGLLAAPCAFAGGLEFVLDEDNDHYFKYPSNMMTVAHLEAYVDSIAAGGKVTRINWCPTGGRASFDSKTWEPIWTGLAERPLDRIYWIHRNWGTNAKILFDRGIDPYEVFLRRSRERGISPWISPRMNDCHDAAQSVDGSRFFRSISLWRNRPDLRFYPDYKKPSWGHHKFNYAKQEVRDSALAMIRELFERYDFDGINLQKGPYFPKEIARESTPVFTRFMRDVRALCDTWSRRRGHAIGITLGDGGASVRDFLDQGIDIVALANDGTIDGVFGIRDPAAWRKAIANRDFKLYATSEALLPCGGGNGPDGKVRRINLTAPMHRERADMAWTAGADGVMLYNVEYQPDVFRELCRYGIGPDDIRKLSRAVKGRKTTNGGKVADGVSIEFDWGSATNGTCSAVVGFANQWQWGLDAKLNGVKAVFEDDSHLLRSYYFENLQGHPFSTPVDKQARRLVFPEGTVRSGRNVLEIAPVEGSEAIIDYAELQLDP